MGERFQQISGSKKQREECSQLKESQSGQQRPRESPDLKMVGTGEGRSNQGLKTGGYTEGKYMKSFPVPPLTTPRSKTQAAWLSSLGKISKELNYLGLLRAPSGMLVLPE